MSSSAEQELKDAFDRFSLWMLTRDAATATTMNLMWCKTIQPHLRNYMVAIATHQAAGAVELTMLEHYLSKKQFDGVSQQAREEAIKSIIIFMNIPLDTPLNHYVHIANECPAVEMKQSEMRLLRSTDMITVNPSSIPSSVLCVISTAREVADAHNRDVYEMYLTNGRTIREELARQANEEEIYMFNESSIGKPVYCIDAQPVNSIGLDDLASELNASPGCAPLGLFLVRQAKLEDIRRYIKKNCVDRLEDVTADTWFLISEVVPFDASFPEHESVHEVAHLENWGIVFWIRSKGTSARLGKHFCYSIGDVYDFVPPAPGWLNVLVSNETDGSTTYLKKLANLSRTTDPFRMVVLLQGIDMLNVLRQRSASTMDKVYTIFRARTTSERFAVARGQLLLLIDHAMDYNGSDLLAKELVSFLNTIDHNTYRLTLWIVGDDCLWTHLTTNCKHAAIKYSMPRLTEKERKECLSLLLKEGAPDVGTIVEHTIESNSRKTDFPLLVNMFFLVALADGLNDAVERKESGPLSYWWIEVLERFAGKYVAPEGSSQLNELKEECYNRFISKTGSRIQQGRQFKHRTLLKLLAAQYLVEHSHLIDVENYRIFDRELIDLLLWRHNSVAIAVMHQDIESFRLLHQNSPNTLRTTTDCLQRNLLHIVNDSPEIAKLLLLAGVDVDQQCPQLNNWTPVQAAEDREDWPIVDQLLAKGARTADVELKLQKMTVLELQKVFEECIAHNCRFLIEWILQNRLDYQITQKNIYCLTVYPELESELFFRLLALAAEQRLPEREPEPYQFIWYNTALDVAVDDERYELAAFLVDRLGFRPTEKFYELQTQHQNDDRAKLEDYKHLFELCYAGQQSEVCRMMEEKALDPFYEFRGSNIFIQAAASDCLELVRYLYEKCGFAERLNDKDTHSNTAMSAALGQGSTAVINFLYECGATVDPDLVKLYSDTLPSDAVVIDKEDFQSLIRLKRDRLERLTIDYKRFKNGELLLHHYLRYVDEPDESTLRFLLAQHDSVDVRTSLTCDSCNGETPLHLAMQSGNIRSIEVLLEAGANVHAKSLRHGQTSLHHAIIGGVDRPMLQLLIEEYGIDVNARDERGRSIAFYMPPDRRLYRWLIDRYGLDVSGCDNAGQTILHYNVINNDFFVRAKVEFLLRVLQFPQHLTDERGRLALHYAVEAGQLPTVRLLLKYRSDLLDVPDGDGFTAVQLASNTAISHSPIGQLLKSIIEKS